MAFSLKDIVLAIKLQLNPSAAAQVQQQIQSTIATGTQQGVAAGKASAAQFEASWNKVLNSLATKFMAVFGIRAMYKFIEDSIMAFAKFDQRLQQSVAIMQGVNASMRKNLGDAARDVAKQLNLSADDVAGSYYYLASAGLTAMQSIKALPVVATFAKAGMMDLAHATEYLTEANVALGYKSTDPIKNMQGMARIADVLTLASKRSQTTIDQLAQALTNKAGNSLRLFGKSVEEGAAVLAVMANQGVKGALAGERLDIFLRQATQAAVKHKEAFKAYGIQVFDTTGKMRNMADISADLTKAIGGLSDEQQVIALQQLGFQTRTVQFVKQFVGQADAIRQYEETFRHAAGYTIDISNKQLQTPIEQWGLFKQKITDVRREIGENFIASLGKLAGTMGDENNPDSVVGVLKQFAKWLNQNSGILEGMGTLVVWAVKGFMFFMDTMNDLADVLVALTAGPFAIFLEALNVVTIAVALLIKPFGLFINMISGGFFHELNDFSDDLFALQKRIDALAVSAGSASLNAIKDLFTHKDTTSGDTQTPPHRNIGKGQDTGNPGEAPPRTGQALDLGDPKSDKSKADKIQALNDALDAMLAKHTAERADDEITKLNKIEEKYKDVYGKEIPKTVKDAFDKIKQAIDDENEADKAAGKLKLLEKVGATQEQMQAFIAQIEKQRDSVDKASTAWKKYTDILTQANAELVRIKGTDAENQFSDISNIEGIEQRDAAMHDYLDKYKRLMASVAEGSDEWQIYHDAVVRAQKALDALHKQEKKADEDMKKQQAKHKEEERLRMINKIGTDVARNLTNAFGSFWDVMIKGSHRGSEAFETMGRKILASGLGSLADYAGLKAKADFISAADETWKGFADLADPFMAWAAPIHFKAAGLAALQGAAWAALAGGVGSAASAVGGGSIASVGGASQAGAGRVGNSTQQGMNINIFVDGIDPKNPKHQSLVGKTIKEYADRTGGSITFR